jgi:HEAT repeat protein
MNLNILEENINNTNFDKVIETIREIGEKKYQEAAPILIKLLQSTNNNNLRNEIAIALSDMGCYAAVEPIINMLRNPNTIGNRGTLLYALETLDYSSHIELLIDLLFDDNFEVSRQTLILIESILKDIPHEVKEKYIQKIKDEIDILQDKINFLRDSLNIFI